MLSSLRSPSSDFRGPLSLPAATTTITTTNTPPPPPFYCFPFFIQPCPLLPPLPQFRHHHHHISHCFLSFTTSANYRIVPATTTADVLLQEDNLLLVFCRHRSCHSNEMASSYTIQESFNPISLYVLQ